MITMEIAICVDVDLGLDRVVCMFEAVGVDNVFFRPHTLSCSVAVFQVYVYEFTLHIPVF